MKTSWLVCVAALVALNGCGRAAPEVGETPDPKLESMINQQAETAAPGSEMVTKTLFRGIGYDKGDSQDFRVELQAGQCYVFVGAADETVGALQLFLWDPSESRVESDRSKKREALMQYCPKETGTFKLQGKIGKGAGHFAIGVFGKEAPEKPVVEAPKDDKLDLEKMITDEATATAPGATQVGNFYTGTASKNDFFVQLEKGTCYWFIGAAQKGVDDYYIYLWDQNNKRMGETKASSNKAQFGHCAEKSSMYRVQVKVDSDKDEVKLGIFAKKGK